MAWFVPHLFRGRPTGSPAVLFPDVPAAPIDFDRVLDALREVRVAVPCGGCGAAHEMTCAELIARQLIQGSGGSAEECDGGIQLAAILSPEDVIACGGDVRAVRAALERRGALRPEDGATARFPALAGRRELHHHILPPH